MNFIIRVRQQKNGKVSPALTINQVQELEALGFEWQIKKPWVEHLKELKAFKAKYGHCNVPTIYPENQALGRFVAHIRAINKNSNKALKAGQIQELEALGFEWQRKKTWPQRIKELKHFKAKHGHCNVPSIYPENPSLGNFVKFVRQQKNGKRKPALSVAQIQELDALGFKWGRKK